jgi:ATP-dependent Lon protease
MDGNSDFDRIVFEIEQVHRSSHPQEHLRVAPERTLRINNTQQLTAIANGGPTESPTFPSPANLQVLVESEDDEMPIRIGAGRKRRRNVIDSSDDEAEFAQPSKKPRSSRRLRRMNPEIELGDDELDQFGNLKDLIDDGLEEDPNDRDFYDYVNNRMDEHDDQYEVEYRNYLKTLGNDERNELKLLEKELKNFNQDNDRPLKYRILKMNASMEIKSLAMSKLKNMSNLDHSSPDYAYEWSTLNSILDIPWGETTPLPVTKDDGPEAIQKFLLESLQFLDTVTYGQHKAKSTMMLELGSYLENPDSCGFILGVKGPVGSGKTTLIANGLARILGRYFYRIDLGGAKHADTLMGSRKVFERADMGDLAKAVIKGKKMDPLLFLDEFDKVSKTEYGIELLDALNDLTDKNRNNSILDQYLGVHMDLSKAVIVFAYNSSDDIPLTLRSRIHEIEIEPYETEDKIQMVKQFFLPKSCEKLHFSPENIRFSVAALRKIILDYTNNEEGVRKLEERIDEIILKLNWARLTSGSVTQELVNYHGSQLSLLKFPFRITVKNLSKLLT